MDSIRNDLVRDEVVTPAGVRLRTQTVVEWLADGGRIRKIQPSRRGRPHQAGGRRRSWPVRHAQGSRWGRSKLGRTSDANAYTAFRVGTTASQWVGRVSSLGVVIDARERFLKRRGRVGDKGAGSVVQAA